MDKITEGDLVIVSWDDAIEENAWVLISSIQKAACPRCKSAGWFLSQDDNCIRILTSITNDKDASYILIPIKMINNIEKIREDELDLD